MTFRAIRRFSDIAFPDHPLIIEDDHGNLERMVNEDNQDDWIVFIKNHIREGKRRYERHQRGVAPLPTESDYGVFLDLCERAGVAMFYSTPTRMYAPVIDSHAHFLCPRWEVAIDMSRARATMIDNSVEQLLMWITDEDGLVRDEVHAVGDFDEAAEGLPLFIPDVVHQAHEMVVYTRDRHVPNVEEMLHTIVRDIREGKFPALQV